MSAAEDRRSTDRQNTELRNDIRRLGEQLGHAVARQEDARLPGSGRGSACSLVACVVTTPTPVRNSPTSWRASLIGAIRLVRAFTTYFHLANVAEQVHRIDDLNTKKEGVGRFEATVDDLIGRGFTSEQIQAALAKTALRPVFTAHPTGRSRRSMLDKLAEIPRP
ncbi:MAG: phosphoenolpyruvate carboxylase [Acidimicrobiales bacterium]